MPDLATNDLRGTVACLLAGDINIQARSDPRSVFANIHETLSAADVLYGNLEGCLYRPGENDIPGKEFWQHSDISTVLALTSTGFDAVGCANNMMFGVEATLSTLQTLDKAAIAHCGAGKDRKAARAPAILERRGVQIGLLQFTAKVHAPEQIARDDHPGVAAFDPMRDEDLAEIQEEVRAVRLQVDFLIVSHHLRRSGSTDIEPYQREFAHRCIDAGADLIFGHGGHVNQGIERWKGVPIFHCIGPLAFDWWRLDNYKDGLLVRVLIDRGSPPVVSALLVHRDHENNPYIADPGATEGLRQFDELRRLSCGVHLSVRECEIILG
jgi:poly-gamma-glutamate capsule biosynthesis protein CapA/YwtB (metallophosphatase superfamily)